MIDCAFVPQKMACIKLKEEADKVAMFCLGATRENRNIPILILIVIIVIIIYHHHHQSSL